MSHEDDDQTIITIARRLRQPTKPAPGLHAALEQLLDAPSVASKRWVFEQYDSTVRAATAAGPGGDAGVVEGARGTGRPRSPVL